MKGAGSTSPSIPRRSSLPTGLLVVAVLIVGFTAAACMTWEPISMTEANLEREQLVGRKVRVATPTGFTEFVVSRLEYPIIEGTLDGQYVAIDLSMARSLAVRELDFGKTVLGTVTAGGALILTVSAVVALLVLPFWLFAP